MARRAVASLTTMILAVTVLSGCFGDVDAVYVPDGRVPADWIQRQDNKTEDLSGGIEVILNEYRYTQTTYASVYAVGATDVPFVDEAERLRKMVRDHAANAGVTLTKTGSSTQTLDNGKKVEVDEYDIRKTEPWGEARGKAWLLAWDAGDFFGGAIGYATTEYASTGGGILTGGPVQDGTQWQETQAMLLALDW